MSLRIAISLFFLVTFAHSACLNQFQTDGKCTQCIATEVLINGFCFPKLRGCLRYAAGPICVECQFGYILNRTACVREAEFNNNTNLSYIPPVLVSSPTLTFEDIRNKIGEQFGAYAGEANTYFVNKYLEANRSRIVNVDRLETKKGVFISIDYEGSQSSRYQAIAFVNNSGSVKEWSFGAQTSIKNDPISAGNSIKAVLGDKLKDHTLYQINQQGDIYIFDYMNPKFDLLRVAVNKGDIGSANLATKIRTRLMSSSELVQQMLVSQYPNLKDLKIAQIQKYDDYFIITFSPTLTVSFKINNYNFNINKPVDSTPATAVGYSNFTNYTDSRLIASIETLAKELPDVIGSQIVRVQSQTVLKGINFVINLKKSIQGTTLYDEYQFRVTFNLDKTTTVVQAKKNGKIVYSSNYNYNLDPQFFKSYKIMEQWTNILNIPPIDSVTMENSSAKVYYKVMYLGNEYSQFEYYPNTNQTSVLSYTIDGQNLLQTLLDAKPLAERRAPEVLLGFIQTQDPRITTNAKIKQLIVNLPTYNIILATSTGTYMAVVEDKGSMNLVQITTVSNLTCFTMQTEQAQVNSSIKTIDIFLKNNYPLTDYNLQMVQINVPSVTTVGYRFLYANSKLKQVEIYLEETSGTANVTKASFTNFGYSVTEVDPVNSDVAKIVNYIKANNLAGSKIPFFIETNGTVVKAYYDDGKNVTEIFYDKAADKFTMSTAYTRTYVLVPDGFAVETLMIPGTPSSTDNATITRIGQEALKKYSIILQDASIVYVDRKSTNNYLFLYKSTYGHLRFDATMDAVTKAVTFGRLVISTGYRVGDFSNCQKYQVVIPAPANLMYKCLSCDRNTEVEFQGACHKIIEGCLIQAGPICVKCNADYVKSAYKCYRECSFFFK